MNNIWHTLYGRGILFFPALLFPQTAVAWVRECGKIFCVYVCVQTHSNHQRGFSSNIQPLNYVAQVSSHALFCLQKLASTTFCNKCILLCRLKAKEKKNANPVIYHSAANSIARLQIMSEKCKFGEKYCL